MKLTDFQTKFVWGIGILIILLIWMIFPLIFKQLISVYDLPENLKEFGAFGDIYGSLNTLISSIALCAVAFSTWLQVTSLKETRETNEKQLSLADKSHQEQLKETKYSIFSNMFYELLNQKNQKYQNLVYKGPFVELHIDQVVNRINEKLFQLITIDWTDISTLTLDEVCNAYFQTLKDITEEDQEEIRGDKFSNLSLYFRCYENLYELINRSELEKDDKEFFKRLVRDSMTIGEQVTLFWIGTFDGNTRKMLRNKVIDSFFDLRMMPFAVKFLDKNCFSSKEVLDAWHHFEEEQKNPLSLS